MIKTFLDKLKTGDAKREDLADILALLKEDAGKAAELKKALEEEKLLTGLFSSDDAKLRKNTAKLIGVLKLNSLSKAVYEAYLKEETLFVKPAMVEALCELSDRSFQTELTERLRELEKGERAKEELKHIAEELKYLRTYTGAAEHKAHSFSGFAGPAELMLTTVRGAEQVTADRLKALNPRVLSGAVRVSAEFLRDVLPVRTIDEILFLLPNFKPTEFEPEALAAGVAESRILAFLDRRHKEQGLPYRFRTELKSSLDSEKKINFTKRFSALLEDKSGYKLINSVDDYELELRVIERKDGRADCLLKICTIPDNRFAYRKEQIAAGLKPVTAATAIALAAPYLKENAQVLDSFCGVGTLLIERAIFGKVKNLYGTDTFGPAIDKARKNTTEAGFKGNYINRDFFDFKHDYPFDEIITELPYLPEDAEPAARAAMKLTYRHFLEKAPEHLKEDGVIVALAKHCDIFENFIERFEYKLELTAELGNKEKLYILKK